MELRIPMRGYEDSEDLAAILSDAVTNPHAGL